MIFASQMRVSKVENIQACKVNNIAVIAAALMYDWAQRVGIPMTHKLTESLETVYLPILDMYQYSENESHDDNSDGSELNRLCLKLSNEPTVERKI